MLLMGVVEVGDETVGLLEPIIMAEPAPMTEPTPPAVEEPRPRAGFCIICWGMLDWPRGESGVPWNCSLSVRAALSVCGFGWCLVQ